MAKKDKQMNVRVPKEIHRRAKIESAKTGENLSSVVTRLLREWLAEQEQSLPKK